MASETAGRVDQRPLRGSPPTVIAMTDLDDYVRLGWTVHNGLSTQSSFSAAVRDARQVSGRDTESGEERLEMAASARSVARTAP